MLRYTIACALVTVVFFCNLLAADDTPTEFKMRPIGHVKKSEDRTLIVLDRKYQPGLLGVDGYQIGWRGRGRSVRRQIRQPDYEEVCVDHTAEIQSMFI